MAKADVTKTNLAVERLLETTENPLHRFLLQAYHRHRFLEIAGRYEEIFTPEMTVENPIYHFHSQGINATLRGQEAVKGLYREWADTNQAVFVVKSEQIAVADNFVASVTVAEQQILGSALIAGNIQVDDPNAMYLYTSRVEMIWPYDDRGRLVGEDVWEPDPDESTTTMLDPADVLTTAEAAAQLKPLIKPLPSFDEAVMSVSRR